MLDGDQFVCVRLEVKFGFPELYLKHFKDMESIWGIACANNFESSRINFVPMFLCVITDSRVLFYATFFVRAFAKPTVFCNTFAKVTRGFAHVCS